MENNLSHIELNHFLATIDPQCEGLIFKAVGEGFVGFSSEDPELPELACVYICKPGFQQKIQFGKTLRQLSASNAHAQHYDPLMDWGQLGKFIKNFKVGLIEPDDEQPLWTARVRLSTKTYIFCHEEPQVAIAMVLYEAHKDATQ